MYGLELRLRQSIASQHRRHDSSRSTKRHPNSKKESKVLVCKRLGKMKDAGTYRPQQVGANWTWNRPKLDYGKRQSSVIRNPKIK